MIFALVGNQNCGKTTLFNALTGSNQHVGNFPGVTVDQKIGEVKGQKEMSVVDLPGIYSIRPYSVEEIVTRDFVLNEKPDGIINIIDATNPERNLYLTLQLLELRIPTVVAMNMMDELRAGGGTVDVAGLSQALGVPVVPISAVKNEGISELINQAANVVRNRITPSVPDFCPAGPVHRCIHAVSHLVEDHADRCGVSARFAATKLIEGDESFFDRLQLDWNEKETLEHTVVQMEEESGFDRNAALASMRYDFIEKVCGENVVRARESREHARSVKIDTVLTNRFLALPIFFAIMLVIFWLTFGPIGGTLSDLLADSIRAITVLADKGLSLWGVNPVVHGMVIDGIFAGVGSVLSFLPIIVVLFFFLSILEDTGYMARVAFVMDKLLRKVGLSGRSFVPMIIGFGCTVPAVMSARTLSSERDRRMTVLLTPFMSCSAKIPIYAVFCAAFFPRYPALVMMGLYLFGMAMGVVSALVFSHTVYRGKPVPFVMELPNYRLPGAKNVGLLLWDKARDFLQRAFTVIFVATLIIWFLGSFDYQLNYTLDRSVSLLAMLGQSITPVFRPLGFADWRVVTSLLAGFSAKEAVVSTLGILTGVGMGELTGVLQGLFTIRSALSFLSFTLLYTPCVAAISTFKSELRSGWKATGVAVMQCLIAWLVALLVYTVACLF